MSERNTRSATPSRSRRDSYDEVRYRESLRALGLFAPVVLDDIQQAYRSRAKQLHPDRFAMNGAAGRLMAEEATQRIQKLNVAHEYVVHHYREFDRSQGRRWRWRRTRATKPSPPPGPRPRGGGHGERLPSPPASPFVELLLSPITLLYSLALLIAALPGVAFAPVRALAHGLDEEPEDGRRWPAAVWSRWIVLGPHFVTVAGFLALESTRVGPPWARWWLGVALLIMASTDLATRMTGESNPLRRHRLLARVQKLVGGAS
ncbi:MAG TPA: J domain-containing protein [Gemmatimonadota bacterium]|nr:J domain-containing protein [Gemmatimonadota bacterium]